ncbi:Cyclophilin-like domain containing protein [Amanita muscaria]
MEGYYDGVIFHRVVPGFLVQTGDRTGTGGGGESFYGEPFEDEIHPRLRFPHRGLVAMANRGTKDSNDSQFIITLDRADELHGKHTLFGRCVGDTFYNVLKISEMELDESERPLYPPKIKGIRIIDNPFDDIVPRITAEEKRVQQRAKVQAQKEREEMERRRGAKKNVKLLSFGGDEEEETTFKKKTVHRPDLMEDQPLSGSVPDFVFEPALAAKNAKPDTEPKKEVKAKEDDLGKIREKHAKEQAAGEKTRKDEIAKMEAEIRKLGKKREDKGSDGEDEKKKKAKKSYLTEELAKYSKGRGTHKKGKDGKKRVDESDVLAALDSFRGKLSGRNWIGLTGAGDKDKGGDGDDVVMVDAAGEGVTGTGGTEDPGMEVDADLEFMTHALHFPKDNTEETQKAERDYEVIDPRQRGAKAKEEERERRRASRKGHGAGHRR